MGTVAGPNGVFQVRKNQFAPANCRHRLAHHGAQRLSLVVVRDLELAFAFFDRILLLDRGQLVADASPSQLIDDPILDRVFGVRFQRVVTDDGTTLKARRS